MARLNHGHQPTEFIAVSATSVSFFLLVLGTVETYFMFKIWCLAIILSVMAKQSPEAKGKKDHGRLVQLIHMLAIFPFASRSNECFFYAVQHRIISHLIIIVEIILFHFNSYIIYYFL